MFFYEHKVGVPDLRACSLITGLCRLITDKGNFSIKSLYDRIYPEQFIEIFRVFKARFKGDFTDGKMSAFEEKKWLFADVRLSESDFKKQG